MKGKIKYFLIASLLSLASLTGCGTGTSSGGDEGGDGGDGGGGGNPMDTISGLDIKVDEAKNKLKQLGSTQGFEITVEGSGQDETGAVSSGEVTVGFKVETAWLAETGAYVMTRDGTEFYEYAETADQYNYVTTLGSDQFDTFIDAMTAIFYAPLQYDAFLNKVEETTFVNRAATKYEFAGALKDAYANVEVIIDNATGIALKFSGVAQDLDGNTAAGSLEVKSFKTGEDVVRPELVKKGSDGGTTVDVESVSVSPNTLSLYVGDTSRLVANVLPANATDKTVTWESSNPSVVKVEQNGAVSALAEGSARIMAKAGRQVGYCSITVSQKQGGEGGEGGEGGHGGEGEQTVTLPQAGKYSYNANLSTNPGIYKDGYLQINEDGSGVYCIVGNYLGERVWYTASFELSGQNIVAHTVFKYTETIETGRSKETAEQVTYTFTFEGDANWSIEMNDSKIYYQYDQGQGGDTPVDDLEDALITAEQYASLVTGMAYVGAEGNAKFNVEVKANKNPFYNETLECDNGNYQDGVAYTNDDPVVRIYAGFEGHPGYYYIFERQSDYSWQQTSKDPYQIELIQFASMAGLDLLSYVPFDRLSAPAFVEAPYYSCSSFTYKDDELGINVSLSNIKIYFEEGKLVHFSYVSDGYMSIDVQVTDIGKVKVEIPEIKPEEKEEQHNELLYGTNGAKFVFSSADKGGYTGSDFDALIAAIQNCYFNFFPDGSAELHNAQAIYLGTFTAMKKASENTAAVSVRFTQKYVISNQDLVDETTSEYFTYYVTKDELHLIQKGTQNGNQVEIHIIFTRSNDVPTPFEPSEPQPSKWPTEAITTALQKLGLKANVPEMPSLDNIVGDVDVKTVGETLQITVEYDTKDNADIAEYQYYSMLIEKGAYKVDYANSDFDEGIFVYLSNDNAILLTVTYNGTTGITIKVEAAPEPEVPSYPEEAIDSWLLSHGVTDEIIEFTCEGASYDFEPDYNSLSIYLPNGVTATNVINGFIEDLTENHGYEPVTIAEYTAYVGPDGTIGFIFFNYDSIIGVGFADSSQLPQSSDSYPTSTVEQYLADMKITDSVPEFTCEGATYDFYGEKGEDGVWSETIAVGINLPDDADYELIAEQFVDLLTGYTEEGDYYLSPNKQVCVEIYAIEGFVGITIYPYVQEYVDITIIAYGTRTVEGQRVYLVGDFCNWDLTDENAIALEWNAELNAWVGNITAEVGSEIYCKLIITSWDNPGEYITWEREGIDNERIYDVPDTDTTFTLYWGNY